MAIVGSDLHVDDISKQYNGLHHNGLLILIERGLGPFMISLGTRRQSSKPISGAANRRLDWFSTVDPCVLFIKTTDVVDQQVLG